MTGWSRLGYDASMRVLLHVLVDDVWQFRALMLVSHQWLRLVCALLFTYSGVYCTEDFAPQGSEAWHALRRLRITAAKVAGVVGLGWYWWTDKPEYYQDAEVAYRTWTEQRREEDGPEIPFMVPCQFGTVHEERVRIICERLLGVPIKEAGSFGHAKLDYVRMSPDGLIPPLELRVRRPDGAEATLLCGAMLLEVKTSVTGLPIGHHPADRSMMIAHYKIAHAAQITQQLAIMGWHRTLHPYWVLDTLLIFLWEFSPDLWAWMLERIRWQWEQYQAGARDIDPDHAFARVNPEHVEDLWFNGGARLTPEERAMLPPAPRVLSVYLQQVPLGPLADGPQINILGELHKWPGSPPDTDPVYDNWRPLPDMPTEDVDARVVAIRRLPLPLMDDLKKSRRPQMISSVPDAAPERSEAGAACSPGGKRARDDDEPPNKAPRTAEEQASPSTPPEAEDGEGTPLCNCVVCAPHANRTTTADGERDEHELHNNCNCNGCEPVACSAVWRHDLTCLSCQRTIAQAAVCIDIVGLLQQPRSDAEQLAMIRKAVATLSAT